jgi:hydroxymethylglutaryl-CoA lyase
MNTDTNAEKIVINEVGLRDGLQNHSPFVETTDKLALLRALERAGVASFEVSSFVNPKNVPQMADAERLFAQLHSHQSHNNTHSNYSALIANARGFDRAVAAGVREVGLVVSTTDAFNQKNINMTTAQAMDNAGDIILRAKEAGIRIRTYVAGAFDCPYTGAVHPETVFSMVEYFFVTGASEICIADTIGSASPSRVTELMRALIQPYGSSLFSLHLHDTRGMALANAWAGVCEGIRKFDSAVGGLGGCPFAPGAAGNVATEDLVFMLHECGFDTGIDMNAAVAAVDMAQKITGRALGGRIYRWHKSQAEKSAATPQR